ncbi:pyruvate carboxylase [Gordonia sp. (in: high G+C Gram-positive bacteria)]|uniref:pyruvate carboxylase n=1 Tax=Gordonia sp. (in: high G+C Gram-positive bacteria) TaxID=84139 RepID=UPI0016BAE989|nr:pyruvate carboxylase [Gordonia sp. (in: high G+C Gram-positive bacteria)]NLG48464.1 pyruvate carboxylase [Gordonia sp. (in: high G+C Gram-positive bacteria)]
MFRKILVANRGEIAIRALRAAVELGVTTVAVYPHEDRNSPHRFKADEAYQIGEPGHPVRAYLDVSEIIRVAKESGADAVYPGYGFLSENPELAYACESNGITFVGPAAEVLQLTGNKSRAIAEAKAAGLPVLASTEPSTDPQSLVEAGRAMKFPVFVKAVSGGGGRGMRRVDDPALLSTALDEASREAESAFGDGAVYIEQAVMAPRHIEVQVFGDASGDMVHLYERDCSVQRRHQKVIEQAPAPDLPEEIRDRMCADAVAYAKHIGYSCAGTVEYLLDGSGDYVFIEMNPRIQVEHTVTEEVTDVDLVQTQMLVAAGARLTDLGLTQDQIHLHGAAVQCRITTEDPANDFRPDTGRVTAYRSPGGAGIRLDGGTTVGAEVGAYFDSMLVKLTCRGSTREMALARAGRALVEFRIRGVTTNIPFLRAVLDDPTFRAGAVDTGFIAEHPELLQGHTPADRGTRMLSFLADVTVNRPNGKAPSGVDPATKLPMMDPEHSIRGGSRQRLLKLGPEAFAADLRSQSALAITDTTFRDAHQSLLATRVRTKDLTAVAGHVATNLPDLFSIEAWGGATYDVALRFLHEDPWERLARLRKAVPNICLQMLLRGRNTVGYTPYPTAVTDAFVAEAAETGIDIFRIFDALNDVDQMKPAIDAVRATGTAVAEVALCYTGDLTDPAEDLYTLDYYLQLAEKIVDAGAHILAIKDMAGLMRAPAAATLVSALRSRFDLPVHVHTHDTPGGQLASYLAATAAGADAVDVAAGPMSGGTSQPSMAAVVAAMAHTDRDTGIDLTAVCDLEPYWESMRGLYRPFEAGIPAPTGRVYTHEIPGGQLSNLRAQAGALGLADRFEDVENAYAGVDEAFGRLIKVTPSSKVVGDLALALVGAGVTADQFAADPTVVDLPDSVTGFFRGELGTPVGGWPEPLRTRALGNTPAAPPPLAELTAEDHAELAGDSDTRRKTLSRLLFPGPARDFIQHADTYGDTSVLGTREFLYGLTSGTEHHVHLAPGVTLLLGLESISDPDERGMRTVMFWINGQLRPVRVRDRSIEDARPRAEKADPTNPGHVPAPFAGVVTLDVAVGDEVAAGSTVAHIEAMKMEAAITVAVGGTVARTAIQDVAQVENGDLLVIVDPS